MSISQILHGTYLYWKLFIVYIGHPDSTPSPPEIWQPYLGGNILPGLEELGEDCHYQSIHPLLTLGSPLSHALFMIYCIYSLKQTGGVGAVITSSKYVEGLDFESRSMCS